MYITQECFMPNLFNIVAVALKKMKMSRVTRTTKTDNGEISIR